jgi:ABC-type uncharacterized transport system auxiliary subunit
MTIKRFTLACVSLTVVLAPGCGKVRHPDYYMLAVAPTLPPPRNGGRTLGTLEVRDFETPTYLREGRIVYRESPTQVGFYEYHRWGTDPATTITGAVVSALRSSGLFSQVGAEGSHIKADFLLRGQLESLDEIDYGGGLRVEVKLSAQLINVRTASSIWSGSEAETARVEKNTVNSIVIEMSDAAQKCIGRLLADMQRQISNTIQRSSDSENSMR